MSTSIDSLEVEANSVESNLNDVPCVPGNVPGANFSALMKPVKSNLTNAHSVTSINLGSTSSVTATATPPVKFTLFPKLPIELRRKVWRKAITPRIIFILEDDSVEGVIWKAITSGTIALLSVNTESRSEALTMYETPFNPCRISGQEAARRGPCYVNFAHDLIYINYLHFSFGFNIIFVDDMLPQGQFMNLALDIDSLERLQEELPFFRDNVYSDPLEVCGWTWDQCKLRFVKELVVVVGHMQDPNNSKKIILSEETSGIESVKKSTEAAFADIKTQFPNVVFPEFSSCYRLLGSD
ncbi:hypothetical protein BKA64DRAFT_635205 [Cadophora sp. MPI-SDFR-AT-0126]|nr:hypothetical protein BKA64DRAFT_635205 [Leotiomycetes sp. MPI-SDFR-AT-0126]